MLAVHAIARAAGRVCGPAAFGLVGSGNLEMVNELVRSGTAYYGARHEGAAVAMADAYARVTGTLGLATVHQGPGVTNTLTSLTEAARSRTPMLVLAGETAARSLFVNQRLDQSAVAAGVGAGVERLRDPESVVDDVLRSARRARRERRPVVLSMPVDIQEGDCPWDGGELALPAALAPARPSAEAVAQAADLIEAAQRPVIIAGRGAVLAGARDPLVALGERAGAVLATSAVANGLFAGDPFAIGISGGFASPMAARLLAESDLVLVFGAALTFWTTRRGELISDQAAIVHVDLDPAAIGAQFRVDVGVVGDAAETARALAGELTRRGGERTGWRTEALALELRAYRRADEIDDASTADTMDPRSLMVALDELLPAERTVAIDCGHFMGWPAMYMRVPDPAGFVFCQAFQSVGLGLAGGIAAAIARPDRVTVAVLGDGGTLMSLGELETAARLRVPLLVVIVNDAAYGAEVHHFAPMDRSTDLVFFPPTDFAAVGRSVGAQGHTVRRVDELSVVTDWLAAPDGPLVLDCRVNPEVSAEWLEEAFKGGG